MAFDLGRWSGLKGRGVFRPSDGVVGVAGISGGRTSGMMATLLHEDVILTFQNTGREHPKTYEFVEELDDALGGRIVWLEFRKPKVKGARPRDFGFAVVNKRTADKSGGPLENLLEALAEFRETKGDPPLAPWARQRICTAYSKQKVCDHYVASLGIMDCDRFVGLRYDEPHRVIGLKERDTRRQVFRCPLFDSRIAKTDVMEFWSRQPFDLHVREEQGNCTGCFLKDQGDIARVMMEPESDAPWWIRMSQKYPRFGGARFPGYDQLLREAPERLQIEREIRDKTQPTQAAASVMSAHRFRLVVRQEELRVRGEVPSFSCACEQSYAIGDDGEDDDDLPEDIEVT